MSKLESALSTAQMSIPDCVASGYVDMSTGLLLSVKTVESHPREVLDLVAAATTDLFQGPNVTTIEQMFRKARGVQEDGSHYFEEILVTSAGLIHVFMRCKRQPQHAVVFVCRKSANIGMVIAKARISLPTIESSL